MSKNTGLLTLRTTQADLPFIIIIVTFVSVLRSNWLNHTERWKHRKNIPANTFIVDTKDIPYRFISNVLNHTTQNWVEHLLFVTITLHTVSFDWFLSSLEWILNLKFCLLKLLIFYQKLLWNIRSRLNSSTFWVFEPVFKYVWSN